MVDDGIKLLTGESSVGAAWKAVFPETLSLQSKIAIKINLSGAKMFETPLAVSGAMNIFTWDQRDRAGHKVGRGCYNAKVTGGGRVATRPFILR
ncbi:MAG: hypothetical protein JXA71_15375 [Chitinispirillaceae bacterium]|nr:hypothetical protein [Chitinispirillaceae bacterium]